MQSELKGMDIKFFLLFVLQWGNTYEFVYKN